jgi:DNA-binding transcriptional MerR regulator
VFNEQRSLTIGEAAEELGVTAAWLRFGERLGSLPLARRTSRGWRYYTREDIERLRRLGVGDRKRRLAAGHE